MIYKLHRNSVCYLQTQDSSHEKMQKVDAIMFYFQMKGPGFCISGVCAVIWGLNLQNIHLLNHYYKRFASPSHEN